MHPDRRRAGRRIRKQQRMWRRLRDLSRRVPTHVGALSFAFSEFGTAARTAAAQQDEFARRIVATFGEHWHHDFKEGQS